MSEHERFKFVPAILEAHAFEVVLATLPLY